MHSLLSKAGLPVIGIFSELSADERAALMSGLETQPLKRGDVLVRQGEAADALYIVISGRFSVTLDGRREPLTEGVDEAVQERRKGGPCRHGPPLFNSAGRRRGYCSACTPATSQPLVPLLGLVMFQTSRNGLGPAEGCSRIMPEYSTLAM